MKIIVQEKDGVCLTIPFPTALAAAVVGSRLITKLIKKGMAANVGAGRGTNRLDVGDSAEPAASVNGQLVDVQNLASGNWLADLPEASIRKFQKALKESLLQNRGLTLVEVESADGDYVKIVL